MSVRSQHSRFNIAAGVSAVLFVVGCGVAWHRYSTCITQAERIYREGDDIDAVGRVVHSLSYGDAIAILDPWGADYRARNMTLELAADQYQRHREAILAAERLRYTILPLEILGLLALLPVLWLCIGARRLEKRLAAGPNPPGSIWARLYLRTSAAAWVAAFVSGVLMFVLVVRSTRTSDEFRQIIDYDEEQYAVTRETWITTSHGSLGITIKWRPIHGVTAAQVRELSSIPTRWLPEHYTHGAGPAPFAFPQQKMSRLWGVTWGSWDSNMYPGTRPSRRPNEYAAQVIFPLWPIALLLI